jgi:DNA segregation ATPase FtsK/SpoIIIE, S-DNA-T family
MAKKRKKRSSSKKQSLKLKLKKTTVFSITSVLLIGMGMLIIFSFLEQGYVLTKVNGFLVEWIGFVSLFLPFLLVSMGLMFSRFKTPLKEVNVSLGMVLFFLSLLGLGRTGRAGVWIWDKLEFLITPVGSFIIFFLGSIIGLVVLFNTSIDQLFIFLLNIFKTIKKYIVSSPRKSSKKEPVFVSDGQKKDLSKNQPTSSGPVNQPSLVAESENKESTELVVASTSMDKKRVWKKPPLEILEDSEKISADRGNVKENAEKIEKTLDSFGIVARVSEINMGPAVTQYALEVSLGTKLSKITNLANDLALALAAPTGQIRIEAPIPGRSMVGIEVPNKSSEGVTLKEILASDVLKGDDSKLAVPLGLDVSGQSITADIKKMPHVLIAGQTGAGKSVLLNSWICSFLFRATPDEVRLILVDPKRVEMVPYNGIPHLLTPVIHEPKKVISSLNWAINEMDRRYKLFSDVGVRNIDGYNEMAGFQSLPYILIVIDELADLMLFAAADVEDSICRIAQMARATGIHLILATQRPSVSVLTGLIKANIPTRISFAVSSMIDSRVILDTPGAEKLLGKGDMLYIPPTQAKPIRIQGPFISDQEIGRLTEFLKNQGEVSYDEKVITQPVAVSGSKSTVVDGEERDEIFSEAARLVVDAKKASASLIQRRLKVGYARAARILDQLELAGIVGQSEGSKPREVLVETLPEGV